MAVTDKQKDLPIMYQPSDLHNTPIGSRFIIMSKNKAPNYTLKLFAPTYACIFMDEIDTKLLQTQEF